MNDAKNSMFQLAVRYVHQTGSHLFITGKAGTGKTTFLKYIRENSPKNMVVVAPTGVAAINAGGVTIHSFFQLPFGTFIPERTYFRSDPDPGDQLDPHTLVSGIRMNSNKKKILQELEMVIIDEVSMLRADMLDAIDTILRHFRRQPYLPFGGVQMVFIGDLYQLPPVVNSYEWQKLKYFYKSPFFFDARVVSQAPPLFIELKKIYRQHDYDFINLLNNIRHNTVAPEEIDHLRQYYRPDFDPPEHENYITLTTHNARAETINTRKLGELETPAHTFQGEVNGDFNDKIFPADINLRLKEGAQVMFIKNDKGENRKFYNGKLGTIIKIKNGEITVRLAGSDTELVCERETWRNIRYVLNEEKNRIEEDEIGSFIQYPLRLAWAITIHKSQGLTFEKAIIDAGASFAAGQVYVALSRLTSLEGLVLLSPILVSSISTDPRVADFCRSEISEKELSAALKREEKEYFHKHLLSCFNVEKLSETFEKINASFIKRQFSHKEEAIEIISGQMNEIISLQDVSGKFIRQLNFMMQEAQMERLYHRIHDGGKFYEDILLPLSDKIQAHINRFNLFSKTGKYLKDVEALLQVIHQKRMEIKKAIHLTHGLQTGEDMEQWEQRFQREEAPRIIQQPVKVKPEKGESMRLSLKLFREGNTVAEIAELRNLSPGTIENHLASMIATGGVEIHELVPQDKVEIILEALEQQPEGTLTEIRNLVGDTFSFGEIRAVAEYKKLETIDNSDA